MQYKARGKAYPFGREGGELTNPHRQAELDMALYLDNRARACIAVARAIRKHHPHDRGMLERAELLEDLGHACGDIADDLDAPTMSEFIESARAYRKAQ